MLLLHLLARGLTHVLDDAVDDVSDARKDSDEEEEEDEGDDVGFGHGVLQCAAVRWDARFVLLSRNGLEVAQARGCCGLKRFEGVKWI